MLSGVGLKIVYGMKWEVVVTWLKFFVSFGVLIFIRFCYIDCFFLIKGDWFLLDGLL